MNGHTPSASLPRPAHGLLSVALAAVVAAAAPAALAGPGAPAPARAPAPGVDAAAASTAPSLGGSALDSAVRWMPQSAELVLRVRFADMRTSSLFRSLMTSKPLFAPEMAPLERFASDARLDLGKDLDLGWIGTDGRDGGASVAVLSGRLDGAALGPRLEARGARPTPYGDVTLYALARRPGARGTAGEIIVAFPLTGTALVGSRTWVCIAIDRIQGRGGTATTSLLPLVGRADAGATIWSAAGSRAVSEKIRTEWSSGALGGEDFEGIRTLVATFRIASDLTIDSEAKAEDEDADTLALTLKGLIAVSGLRASANDPSLAQVLKGTRIDRTSGGVRLTTRIPASFVSRL